MVIAYSPLAGVADCFISIMIQGCRMILYYPISNTKHSSCYCHTIPVLLPHKYHHSRVATYAQGMHKVCTSYAQGLWFYPFGGIRSAQGLHKVCTRFAQGLRVRCDAMRCDAMRRGARRRDAMRCDAISMRWDAMRCGCDAIRYDWDAIAMRCDTIGMRLRCDTIGMRCDAMRRKHK